MKSLDHVTPTRTRPMKRFVLVATALAVAATSQAETAGTPETRVTNRNISVTTFVDVGHVIKGSLVNDDGTNPQDVENLFLNRDGVALTYSGTVNDKLHMNIGVGGLFWKPVPEANDAATKRINFGPGISEASARYEFTERAQIKFGFFGYKYNADAVNLGEYLLRSEAYPTVIQTGSMGGWVWMNSNEYKSMGTQFSWTSPGGDWKHDLLLFSEFNQAPLFDFSPSYVVTGKVAKAVEIGAGISFHRWIPIEPSRVTPRNAANTYVEIEDFPAYGVFVTEYSPVSDGGTLKEIEGRIPNFVDSTGTPVVSAALDANGNAIYIRADNGDTLRIRKSEHLTFKAIKLMGRAALDLGVLLDLPTSNGPFRLFGEVGLLGVENQPLYYENITERLPIMVGLSVPTFGILDVLTLQAEYLNNPYPDNNYQQFSNSVPQPTLPGDSPADYGVRKASGQYEDDDLKWSVHMKKTVVAGFEIYLQVANDHFRVQDVNAQPSFMPLTQTQSDWYYMLRFQWSL